ncbi:L-threonylcarbamoyladenylate synthase [Halobacteriovorax marinus]|nr:Sua5/YciO/YrdC/YwlC family protein [Halobacteriovorax marinus]
MTSKLFVYPTDTVWGIGGNIFSNECYEKISKIKGHALKKPLSIVFKNYEMIEDLIDLPKNITKQWLEKYFTLESTIGLPKVWAKRDLPKWICQESEYISIRCMDTPELAAIFEKVKGPVTSTSLNLTGEEPITEQEMAKEFFRKNLPGEEFVERISTNCSGRSSTIVLFDGKNCQFVREGKFINEVKEHFELLST